MDRVLNWDLAKTKMFNFIAHDITTFMDYKVETSFEKSLLVTKFCGEGNIGGDSYEGVQYVLSSLTENSRRVFKELLAYQLAEMNDMAGNGQKIKNCDCGMSFGMFLSLADTLDALYYACVERFFITSRNTFDSILVEFRDHDLIKEEKGGLLYVPLSRVVIENILEGL
jgi:origin recognition complex subunit 2